MYAVDFELGKRDGRKKFAVRRAYTVERLNIAPNPPVNELRMDSWPHLAGLKFPCVNQDDVTILVGMDVVGAHFDSKVRPPPPHLDGPAAFKTPFGWCLGGKMGPPSGGGRESRSILEFPRENSGPVSTQECNDSGQKNKITVPFKYSPRMINVERKY